MFSNNSCQCDECMKLPMGHGHMSDCAVHNEPALPKGKCTCGAINFGIKVSMEGNAFSATYHDFKNLQESPAGFGDTAMDAVNNLMLSDYCPKPKVKWEEDPSGTEICAQVEELKKIMVTPRLPESNHSVYTCPECGWQDEGIHLTEDGECPNSV